MFKKSLNRAVLRLKVTTVSPLLIRAGDTGLDPALIALERIGRHGRSFRMWKLRSMRAAGTDGAATGAVITAGDDDRITVVGARLRRWRLDELPQVWNVLRGEMGLLGPRPETPSLVDPSDPRWARVLAVAPGITGPTQLVVERWEAAALGRDDAVEVYAAEILPVKLAVDAWYVAAASPVVDALVAWSMVERFLLGRELTAVERRVRRAVPEARALPAVGSVGG